MAPERHEGCLLAGKGHHRSFGVADNEVKCCARSVLHKNSHRLVVTDCWYQHPISPFPFESEKAQSLMRLLISDPHAVAPEKIL
jgi:hypothetical protein